VAAPKPERKRVFISYSHKDSKWLEQLRPHLESLQVEQQIEFWDDTKIECGDEWLPAIKKALQETRVAVLLVSKNFLASKFIRSEEVPPLIAAARSEGATLLSVIVSPCRYEHHQTLSRFQSVNPPSKTLLDMTEAEQEKLLVQVTEKIEAAFKAAKPAQSQASRPAKPFSTAIELRGSGVARSGSASLERMKQLFQISQQPGFPFPELKEGLEASRPQRVAKKIVAYRELKGAWSGFDLMSHDWDLGGIDEADGLLTVEEMRTYIQKLNRQRAEEMRSGSDFLWLTDRNLKDSHDLLRDMEKAGIHAVDYLPPELKDFPTHLRRRATELLMLDDDKKDPAFEITQLVINNARSRYHLMREHSSLDKQIKQRALQAIAELAARLGFY
jgi:hypothetical protein